MRPTKEQQAEVIARDGTRCRPCGAYLHSAVWFPLSKGRHWIRICGDCRASEKARELGVSGDPTEVAGLRCVGQIAHGIAGERTGWWMV